MPRPLPPINGLRTFEAAARHLSFTRAANELNVTQAAVSHRIKGLEEQLGTPLFRRLNRRLLLTDAGQALFGPVSEGLSLMTDAVTRLTRHETTGALTISTTDSIAAVWLVPRLGRFRARHPDIDVRISTTDDIVDLARDDVDAAVRYGKGNYPGLDSVRLMTEELFPVCSPALLEQGPPLESPDDLRYFTLIHDQFWRAWPIWLEAAGATHVDAERGPEFSYSDLMIRAAVAGVGVALGRSALVADDLRDGRLVRPFDFSVPAPDAYYFVTTPAGAMRPKVRAFREWLSEEAAASQAAAGV